jgi:hypothetical protein
MSQSTTFSPNSINTVLGAEHYDYARKLAFHLYRKHAAIQIKEDWEDLLHEVVYQLKFNFNPKIFTVAYKRKLLLKQRSEMYEKKRMCKFIHFNEPSINIYYSDFPVGESISSIITYLDSKFPKGLSLKSIERVIRREDYTKRFSLNIDELRNEIMNNKSEIINKNEKLCRYGSQNGKTKVNSDTIKKIIELRRHNVSFTKIGEAVELSGTHAKRVYEKNITL